jgi:hypothetical protein
MISNATNVATVTSIGSDLNCVPRSDLKMHSTPDKRTAFTQGTTRELGHGVLIAGKNILYAYAVQTPLAHWDFGDVIRPDLDWLC